MICDALGGVRVVEEVEDYREIKDITNTAKAEAVAQIEALISEGDAND